jgi:predicted phosphodiesterase
MFHRLRIGFVLAAIAWLLLASSPAVFTVADAPGAAPSRIVLGWAGDPATSQAVTWRTSAAVASPKAQFAREIAGPAVETDAATVDARTTTVSLYPTGMAYHHTARFEGLEPATRYVYRVGGGSVWSEWFAFTTATAGPAPFRFLYLGDAQNGLDTAWPRTVRAAYARAPDARFIVHAGDIVAEGYDDNLWRQWSAGFGFITASLPSFPVPGNHDGHRPPGAPASNAALQPSALWRAHFALPGNGPASLGGLATPFYYVDYQGVRLIALDANPFANSDYGDVDGPRVRQAVISWLRDVLAHNPNRWTIVVQHQPIYPMAKGRDYMEMRDALLPLYDQHHVDLVLQGHDHVYARSFRLSGGHVVDADQPGTVYAISVSGTKMYEIDPTYGPLMAKALVQLQLYQVIAIDGGNLKYESYTADGRKVDGFELSKK